MADDAKGERVGKDTKDAIFDATRDYFQALRGYVDRAVVIFPAFTKNDGSPVVISNYEMDDIEALLAARGLIGPIVREGHPIKCATLASLMGDEHAQECGRCDNRGKIPSLQKPGATPDDEQCRH